VTASLRERLAAAAEHPLVVPGVGTPLEAQCAVWAGFDTLYLSGYATAAWAYGQPDVGLIALDEVSHVLGAVTEAVDVPVICDADTGYGDIVQVRHTVRRLERLGARAIQLEDQVWPKRCGHLLGKTAIPAADHAAKIAAAVRARRDPETLIIGRTDALAPNGLADALDRAKRYAHAGADILFIDAPTSIDDLETIAAELSGHILMANMSESGLTPHLSAQEFHDLGFRLVAYPTSALRIAARVFGEFFTELRATGDSRSWRDRMTSLDELNSLVGLNRLAQFENSLTGAGHDS
jgi:2-methylisocitrate lyase-like PEP mutase family enzyme